MTKPKPAETKDLALLLTFPDSATGEAVIAELSQRLRDSESAFAAHKRRYGDAAVQGFEMFSRHLKEAEAFEHASAHISAVLEQARKRLLEVQQTERQQAGANARDAAVELANEASALLSDLLDQAKEIAAKLTRWNALHEEVSRLNEIARAGAAQLVAMPELPDDAENAAELAAEPMLELGKFLKDRSHEVWVRKQRARRKADDEAKKRAELPTERERDELRARGFDPALLDGDHDRGDPEERMRRGLVLQEIRFIRRDGFTALNRAAEAVAAVDANKGRSLAPTGRLA